jgi:hypothetical protein
MCAYVLGGEAVALPRAAATGTASGGHPRLWCRASCESLRAARAPTEAGVRASAPVVRGLSSRYNPVNYSDHGPRPITAVEFIQKGRSFNVLAADDVGRISLHLRNGSISATAQVKGGAAVRCALPFNTFCALCTDTGVVFYEGKDRRMLAQSCMQSQPIDDGLPGTRPPRLAPAHHSPAPTCIPTPDMCAPRDGCANQTTCFAETWLTAWRADARDICLLCELVVSARSRVAATRTRRGLGVMAMPAAWPCPQRLLPVAPTGCAHSAVRHAHLMEERATAQILTPSWSRTSLARWTKMATGK